VSLTILLLLSCSPKGPGAQASSDGSVCPAPVAWYADADGDGFGAGSPTAQSCVRPGTDVANDGDCDDADAGVNPDATERCNGVDDDCDGAIDPGTAADAIPCWTDADGDGYGDPDAPTPACACAGGLADNDDDCDDTLADIHPGAEEVLYDGIDQACDGLAGDYDADGDGYDWDGAKDVEGTDCDDDDAGVNPGALDLCDDSVDQDCDGRWDECGFDAVNDPLDAWWIVYRDHDVHETGVFGNRFVPAGDSNGNGRPEIVSTVVGCGDGTGSEPGCENVLIYKLLEAPSNTSGQVVDINDATIASWKLLDAEDQYWSGTAYGLNGPDMPIIAGNDLNDDGVTDYVFAGRGAYLDDPADNHVSRIDVWFGPPEYGTTPDHPSDLNLSETIQLTGVVVPSAAIKMLSEPNPAGSWTLAAGMVINSNTDYGTDHPAVMLFGPQHFDGEVDPSLAPSIGTADGFEAGEAIVCKDLDGDGINDLVTAALSDPQSRPGRIWAFAGPVTGGQTLADADLTLVGDTVRDVLGYQFSVTDDDDGDGMREIVATQADDTRTLNPGSVHIFDSPALDAPRVINVDDADAHVIADGDAAPLYTYTPRTVGDIDDDKVTELAVPIDDIGYDTIRVNIMDVPTSGTHLVTEADIQLRTDEEVDVGGGFGVEISSGVDYDGDGWPDLAVGEWYWDGNPDEVYRPYGRLMVFRGAVGAE